MFLQDNAILIYLHVPIIVDEADNQIGFAGTFLGYKINYIVGALGR
jgi:hypothetical protein